MRKSSALLVCIAAATGACDGSTAPIVHPVTHDILMVTTSFTDDYDASGFRRSYSRHDSLTTTLVVDYGTTGAALGSGNACGPTRGRVVITGSSLDGSFKASEEGGPLLTMTGSKSSDGTITGTFRCQTRTLGPHYYQYDGSFKATIQR